MSNKVTQGCICVLILGTILFSILVTVPMFLQTYPGDECLLFISLHGETMSYGNPFVCNVIAYGYSTLILAEIVILLLMFCRSKNRKANEHRNISKTRFQNGRGSKYNDYHIIQPKNNNSSKMVSINAVILSIVATIFVLSTAIMILYGYLITCNQLHYENQRHSLGHATLEKVSLTIHNDNYCGGNNVFIEIVQFSKACQTSVHYNFKKGSNVTWYGSELGSCIGKDFDVHYDEINFKVRSTDGNDFCPKTLRISLNNGNVYEHGNMYDWVDDKQGGFLRPAKIIGGSVQNLDKPCWSLFRDVDFHTLFNKNKNNGPGEVHTITHEHEPFIDMALALEISVIGAWIAFALWIIIVCLMVNLRKKQANFPMNKRDESREESSRILITSTPKPNGNSLIQQFQQSVSDGPKIGIEEKIFNEKSKLEQEITNRQAELEQRNLNLQTMYSNSKIQIEKLSCLPIKIYDQNIDFSEKELESKDFKQQFSEDPSTIYETISLSNSLQSYGVIADFEIANASYSVPDEMENSYESRNSISRMNSIIEESEIVHYESRNPNPYTDYIFHNHNADDL